MEIYCVVFDKSNDNYEDTLYNEMFLKAQQHYFNELLNVRGYVLLNEVYAALGYPNTMSGAHIGWFKDHRLLEDNTYIDFGLTEETDYGSDQIILTFNVMGYPFK